MSVTVRPLAPEDRARWDDLYQGYAAFYRVEQTPEMRDRVWSWVGARTHGVEGFGAWVDETLVGIAHVRPFARPLSASLGGFLDDLFVDPATRGHGVADALFAHLRAEGARRGWTVIRWITAEDNYRARGVYDRVGERTRWVTYDIRI